MWQARFIDRTISNDDGLGRQLPQMLLNAFMVDQLEEIDEARLLRIHEEHDSEGNAADPVLISGKGLVKVLLFGSKNPSEIKLREMTEEKGREVRLCPCSQQEEDIYCCEAEGSHGGNLTGD